MSNRIREAYPSLSAKQQKAAKFMLDHPDEVALKTADVIGKLSDTSETTVIRVCYSLGYTGFSQLQEEIRQSLIEKRTHDPLHKFKETTREFNDTNFREFSLQQDVSYIQNIPAQMDAQVIRTIAASEKIVVVGFRGSFAPAHWLNYALNIIRGNTYLYRGSTDDGIQLISELNEAWLVIAVSFPRYASETIQFVEAAKKKGAKVLGITDDVLAPLGELSDLALTIKTPTPTALKGMPVVFSFLNMIVTGVAAFDQTLTEQRIERYEQSTTLFKPFTF